MSTNSQSKEQILTILQKPTTYDEMTDILGLSKSTVRGHVNDLKKMGNSIKSREENGTKVFYLAADEGEHPANVEVPSGELRSKAAVTSNAKEKVHALIQHLEHDLQGRAPANPSTGLTVTESHEDMVVHRSDDHIGAEYTDEFGKETFSPDIAIDRVRTVSDKVFQLKARQEEAGVDFDTLHILLGGDHLDGIGIYSDQPWEQSLSLPEQLTVASDLYMEFIDRAVNEFESVQIVCQKGNHGELRGDGMGPDDNVDTAFFMTLDRRVRDRGYENVKFIRSQSGNYTNFPLRGTSLNACEHRGHLRHGQNSLEHIGTSAGKKRWLQWLHQHDFDIAYRGHYHEFKIENISSNPVVESGAIVPPADFEESIAEWSEPAATVHGVTDGRPISWMYPINFEG